MRSIEDAGVWAFFVFRKSEDILMAKEPTYEELEQRVKELEQETAKLKRAEEALQESEEKYGTLVENSLTGIYIDQGGRIVFANRKFAEIYGYSRDELIGMESRMLVHPEDRALTDEIRAKRLKGEEAPSEYQARGLKKDGEIMWIARRNTRIEYEGRPAILGNIVELTERKRGEEALRESEERYRMVLEASPDPVVVYDIEGRGVYINPAFTRVFGWTPEELLGKKLDYVPDENWPETQMIIDKVQAGESFTGVKSRRYTKEGGILDVSISAAVYLNADGIPMGSVHILRDITDQKRAEEATKLAYAELSQIFNTAIDGMRVIDKDFNVLRNSQTFLTLAGVSESEAEGKKCYEVFPGSLCHTPRCPLTAIMDGEELVEFEVEKERPDGTKIPCIITATPFRGPGGKLIGIVEDTTNITQRRWAEERLKEAMAELERSNAELQQFAYVASHDLQEPLRKIQAFGDRLKARSAEALDERGRDYMDRMQNAARRMQALIDNLLTLSRITTRAKPFVPVNLSDVVKEVVSDLELHIEQAGGLVETGDMPTIDADPTQMRQLLQNLIENGLKFHQPEAKPVVKVYGQQVNEVCQLIVEDNGIGFEEKYLDRIFAVFQRLHGRGQYGGTGVGLAICQKIVERHGGSITAKSTPGQGATFIVKLPVRHPTKGELSNEQKEK
jgi:two-component system sensor kinase FixL